MITALPAWLIAGVLAFQDPSPTATPTPTATPSPTPKPPLPKPPTPKPPTPKPSPSQTPKPTPSQMPTPTPSPTPVPERTPVPEPEPPLELSAPILDFSHAELFPHLSFLGFSDSFEADNAFGGGVTLRIPSPALSQALAGQTDDSIGFFLDLTVSTLTLDLEPEPSHAEDTVYFLAAGFEYALLKEESSFVSARLGGQYGNFGTVSGQQNGIALLPGVAGGMNLGGGFWVAGGLSWGLSDAGDNILFADLGLQFSY